MNHKINVKLHGWFIYRKVKFRFVFDPQLHDLQLLVPELFHFVL